MTASRSGPAILDDKRAYRFITGNIQLGYSSLLGQISRINLWPADGPLRLLHCRCAQKKRKTGDPGVEYATV